MTTNACIVRQAAQGTVDLGLLETAGLRVRTSATCHPDLIFTCNGTTVAIVLVASGEQLLDTDFKTRLQAAISTSRQPCLLLPSTLSAHPAVLDWVVEASAGSKLLVQYAAAGTDLTSSAMALVQALATPADTSSTLGCSAADWRVQQVEALDQWPPLLSALCGAKLADAEALAFTVFGSLQGVVSAGPDEFMAGLNCSTDFATELQRMCQASGSL